MALNILAEGLLRCEHKLDLILRHLKVLVTPMHFVGTPCPVCSNPIDYQVDVGHNVVVRKCKCSTGKYVSPIPLVPVGGAPNESPPPRPPGKAPSHGHRRSSG